MVLQEQQVQQVKQVKVVKVKHLELQVHLDLQELQVHMEQVTKV